ncbi:cytochrome P450 3A5-like [Argopecten irradians]|uniref:cytochrome P450 3A5-like n=1 Tax=Argopecten irradians TaxID=31199 RepID=UPI0037110843
MDVMGFDTPLWVILVLLAIFFYTILMSRDFLTFRRMGIPGPTPLPIIGNLFAMRKGIRAFHTDAIKKYGKVCGHYEMISSTLIVADKEMLREILVKQFNNFPDRLMIEGFNGDLDHSLVSTKGNQWKHDRSIITPTFSSSKLRKMVPLVQQACDLLMKTTKKTMKNGEDDQVEMKRLFGGFSMDVISSTAFGIHVDSQNNPDDLFVKHAKQMFNISFTSSPVVLLILFFPVLKPLLKKMGFAVFPTDSMVYFRKLTTQLMEERRKDKTTSRSDFLQLMIDSQEDGNISEDINDSANHWDSKQKGITFESIVGNAELLIAAGYETMCITLTMTVYNLATNPDCQDKLRRDLKKELGSENVDYENAQKLQYLDMCINETLRMYPPAMRLERVCVKTTKVKDITIPAGMSVSVPVYAMQHDPEVWEKPDVFNPERFSPTEKAKYDPVDYMPFGHGPRNCIGMRLALLEAKMALADFVRNFRISVGSKTDIPPRMEDEEVLKPTYLWLKLEEIK